MGRKRKKKKNEAARLGEKNGRIQEEINDGYLL